MPGGAAGGSFVGLFLFEIGPEAGILLDIFTPMREDFV